MLTEVRIQGFRCFRNATLRLGPLTALVGANASGKSSALAALKTDSAISEHERWRHSKDVEPTIIFPGPAGDIGRRRIGGHLGSLKTQDLRLDLDVLRNHYQASEVRLLGPKGHHLVNLFATLPRRLQAQAAADFCDRVRVFGDVDARPVNNGNLRLVFQDRWDESVWYEPAEVSDGSILTFAYMLLRFQDPAPDLITIEEPERGLHPYLIGEIVELLRGLATGQFGSPVQVVLATHSPDLLDHLRPEEVRFLRRSREDGSVTIEEAPVDQPGWADAFREYKESLGSAWLSGALGGIPGLASR